MNKLRTSFSLSAECKSSLKVLSEELGISQSGVIETLVREKVLTEHYLARIAFEYRTLGDAIRNMIERDAYTEKEVEQDGD